MHQAHYNETQIIKHNQCYEPAPTYFGTQSVVLREFNNNKESQVQHVPQVLVALAFYH
jgi:hypothetical protein